MNHMKDGKTVDGFLQAKYSSGGPGSDRFDPVDNEVHSSQISDCQRKRKWKHDRGTRSDASPYFELGRVFEVLYGAALAHEHDPAVDENVLKSMPSWDVIEESTYVVQDVNMEIAIGGGAEIVGECDWVVFDESCPGVRDHEEYGHLDKVVVSESGDRTAVFESGDEMIYEAGWTNKIVETKTKKDLDWVHKKGPNSEHTYQVYPYMFALDTDGEIVYMQRNDWDELVVPMEFDPDKWLDCVVRARAHAKNQAAGNVVPPTSPIDRNECNWCDFSHECKQVGGSRWD